MFLGPVTDSIFSTLQSVMLPDTILLYGVMSRQAHLRFIATLPNETAPPTFSLVTTRGKHIATLLCVCVWSLQKDTNKGMQVQSQ